MRCEQRLLGGTRCSDVGGRREGSGLTRTVYKSCQDAAASGTTFDYGSSCSRFPITAAPVREAKAAFLRSVAGRNYRTCVAEVSLTSSSMRQQSPARRLSLALRTPPPRHLSRHIHRPPTKRRRCRGTPSQVVLKQHNHFRRRVDRRPDAARPRRHGRGGELQPREVDYRGGLCRRWQQAGRGRQAGQAGTGSRGGRGDMRGRT